MYKCYCFLIFSNTNESESCSVVSDSLPSQGLYSPWNSPGYNTGVGSLYLSRGLSQPSDWTQISHIAGEFFYQLSHKGSPRILEWVAYPFSSGSSWPKNRTGISCIAGGFFTNWAMREALIQMTTYKCSILYRLCGNIFFLNSTFIYSMTMFQVVVWWSRPSYMITFYLNYLF